MMKSLKAGFTLAEVLVTLMVIGVVAAMTIPTLLSSTDNQQNTVATKKAAAVLSQAAQLLTAKEQSCSIEDNDGLASCMSNAIMGSLNGDEIKSTDGMTFKFFLQDGACSSKCATLEDACGSKLNLTNFTGKGNCGVVVDINGTKGNSLESSYSWGADGFGTSNPQNGSDIVAFTLSGNGARPMLFADGDNPAYKAIYGGEASTATTTTKVCYEFKDAFNCYCDRGAASGEDCTVGDPYSVAPGTLCNPDRCS